jgi:dUTP pyrophosphatase
MSVTFVKVQSEARVPAPATDGSAGYDLTSCEECIIPPHSQRMVSTGLIMQMTMKDCYARVAPRSGLALKHSIDVLAGVVDESYRGVIQVILYNHSDQHFPVHIGDRIAQLIFERIYLPQVFEGTSEDLQSTTRGESGFGSTGSS